MPIIQTFEELIREFDKLPLQHGRYSEIAIATSNGYIKIHGLSIYTDHGFVLIEPVIPVKET
jgi:hypothetical protein